MSESGKKKEGATISAELVLDGGVAATATFDAAPGYELNRGMFYDVEVRSKNQDGAFLQVAALPEGKSIGEVADSFFTKTNPNPNPNPNPHPHPNPDLAVQGLAWSSSSLSYIRYRSMHVKPGVSDVDTITGDDGVAMPVMYLDKRKGTPDGGATFGRQWAKVGGSSWSMRRQCVSVTDTLSPDISISLDCSSGSELEHAVGGFGRSFRRRDASKMFTYEEKILPLPLELTQSRATRLGSDIADPHANATANPNPHPNPNAHAHPTPNATPHPHQPALPRPRGRPARLARASALLDRDHVVGRLPAGRRVEPHRARLAASLGPVVQHGRPVAPREREARARAPVARLRRHPHRLRRLHRRLHEPAG